MTTVSSRLFSSRAIYRRENTQRVKKSTLVDANSMHGGWSRTGDNGSFRIRAPPRGHVLNENGLTTLFLGVRPDILPPNLNWSDSERIRTFSSDRIPFCNYIGKRPGASKQEKNLSILKSCSRAEFTLIQIICEPLLFVCV